MSALRLAAVLLLAGPLSALALENTSAVSVRPVLKSSSSWDGKALAYPAGQAEITGIMVEIAVGGETGWHSHPVPSFGMVLEGELEVELKSGERKRLKAGDTIAEVVNTLHNGRNTGTVPVKLLVFYAGVVGSPLTIKADPH